MLFLLYFSHDQVGRKKNKKKKRKTKDVAKSSGDSDGQKAENDMSDNVEVTEKLEDGSHDMEKLDVSILGCVINGNHEHISVICRCKVRRF